MSDKTVTVKVTGVSPELLRLADERARRQHFGGRAEYIRELIRRDVLGMQLVMDLPEGQKRTHIEIESVFARIEQRDTSHIQPLAPGADSRESIYGDRA